MKWVGLREYTKPFSKQKEVGDIIISKNKHRQIPGTSKSPPAACSPL